MSSVITRAAAVWGAALCCHPVTVALSWDLEKINPRLRSYWPRCPGTQHGSHKLDNYCVNSPGPLRFSLSQSVFLLRWAALVQASLQREEKGSSRYLNQLCSVCWLHGRWSLSAGDWDCWPNINVLHFSSVQPKDVEISLAAYPACQLSSCWFHHVSIIGRNKEIIVCVQREAWGSFSDLNMSYLS